MADPTLQHLATRDYPYETAGNEDGTMFLGIVVGDRIQPISFPTTEVVHLGGRTKSMNRHDADRISASLNIGHRWSRIALTHWVGTARWRDVIRFVWSARRAARATTEPTNPTTGGES